MSVYVDDFKMSGDREKIAPMWKRLGKNLNLEDPVKLCDNVYLGNNQEDVEIPEALVVEK